MWLRRGGKGHDRAAVIFPGTADRVQLKATTQRGVINTTFCQKSILFLKLYNI
nr:MAG TPA: hypothetical protein [Caudoviricetes sp.]